MDIESVKKSPRSNHEKLKRIKDKDLKNLCYQIGILLESGCNIINIFEIIRDQSNKNIKKVIDRVLIDIQNGNSISKSFQNTGVFSIFFISTIKAGEVSGRLDICMYRLSRYYDNNHRLKHKIKNMLIYPSFVCILFFISIILATTMIIPNFEYVFVANEIEPPLLTKIVIHISSILRSKYKLIIVGFVVFIALILYLYRYNDKFKYTLNKLLFNIPMVGKIMTLIVTTRFCSTLRILIESGVHITNSVDISGSVINNRYIYSKILISKDYINKGNSISDSLKLINIFPNSFINIIKIGEESGRLEDCLKSSEEFYTNQLKSRIEEVVKMIEPSIIAVIGIVVGLFIISMVLPMFELVSSF